MWGAGNLDMDVSVTNSCRDSFLSGDQRRGQAYYDGDLVVLEHVSASSVAATVRGSYGQQYNVTASIDRTSGQILELDCDCPRFADGFNCKHLWATLLAWDAEPDRRSNATQRRRVKQTAGRRSAAWKSQVRTLQLHVADVASPDRWRQIDNGIQRLWFSLCLAEQVGDSKVILRLFQSRIKTNGDWGKPQRKTFRQDDLPTLSDTNERQILSLLEPHDEDEFYRYSYHRHSSGSSLFTIPQAVQDYALELLAGTGRFVWTLHDDRHLDEFQTLAWDDGPPWSLTTVLQRASEPSKQKRLELVPLLVRDDETRPLSEVVYAFGNGLVLFQHQIGRLVPEHASWIQGWQSNGMIQFPDDQLDGFLSEFSLLPNVPEIVFDKDLEVEAISHQPPQPKLVVEQPRAFDYNRLPVKILMKYDDHELDLESDRRTFWDSERRRWRTRNLAAEEQLVNQLRSVPIKFSQNAYETALTVDAKKLPEVVSQLATAGWEVVALGKITRSASSFDIQVTSETDWFDLKADVDFGGVTASLPTLLAAVRQRSRYLLLDDGSQGILPEEWLEKYAQLAEAGTNDGAAVRFSKSQSLLLDALLSERENVTVDRDFVKYCKQLKAFQGVKAVREPRSFQGSLRPYQQDGLGWLGFLRKFEFGGCLADDMGLGKTVQVLAMLQARRSRRLKQNESRLPSIAVVPKSLIFNWLEEAARFTPRLRLVNYTGSSRAEKLTQLAATDLLVTTYGTLRRDIGQLAEIAFDYAILDEAQAIKNAKSQAAKACRLLQANFRLAMTGTPIENHLGELWSLFDFLNPGMLGQTSTFQKLTTAQNGDAESLDWLGRALRPFILRRTKQQVLNDLPEKTEQTLYCEMNPKQAKLYRELRDHYRGHISKQVEKLGLKRAKIHVLEALLRLRQAACDPRLIDDKQKVQGAKLELLLEQLSEVIDEGHKALVFSQFTSLLALVRTAFDERGWSYEYLDGKTRKRGKKVHRFQEDDACKLFLISLKAGGHGLNLTAADYVFILDPWWNPAVEAQAVDRAHRIGQSRPVMAYRIICRNTVEEKILQLQQSKRDLANAVITANQSLIKRLSADDLQMLFE